MTKTILIGIVAIAFVAGSIMTSTMASAAPPSSNPGQPFAQILSLLTDPIFGLEEIKTEVASIEATVNALSTGSGTHLVEVVSTATVHDDDFVITCPVTSSACIIKGIYLDNDTVDPVNPGVVTLTIDGENPFVVVADGDNLPIDTNRVSALNGVMHTPLGSGDSMRLEMDSFGTNSEYSIRVIAEVDVDSTIVVSRIGNLQ